jgi:hypothetical protein
MNGKQKTEIQKMRTAGVSYAKIAATLGISENTVKSFCRRSGLKSLTNAASASGSLELIYCIYCGAPLRHTTGARKRRFCSDKCRISWWNLNPDKHSSAREFVCQSCGRVFKSYGGRERKYCSRACYGKSKAAHS